MAYKIKKINRGVERRDYSKITGSFPLPNLIEVQTDTFDWFKNEGIEEVFQEFFPIQSNDNLSILTLDEWGFEAPTRTIEAAKEESKIFEAPIYVNLKLAINRTEEISKEFDEIVQKDVKKVLIAWLQEKTGVNKIVLESVADNSYFFKIPARKASAAANKRKSSDEDDMIQIDITDNQEKMILAEVAIYKSGKVYLGDFPLMTEAGTFIINGSQKIIVSQLVRSPGAYYKKEINVKTGENIFSGDIIPSRGTWLEFETDSKKVNSSDIPTTLSVKIDKARKSTATSLLSIFGLKKDDVLDIFDNDPVLVETYNKDNLTGDWQYDWSNQVTEIYKKIRQGEISTPEGAIKFIISMFFDRRKYDLTKAGRFKLQQKLAIKNRILGTTIAENIVDDKGEVLVKKNTLVTKENIQDIAKVLDTGVMSRKVDMVDVTENKIGGSREVQKLKIYKNNETKDEIVTLVGITKKAKEEFISIADILSTISYLLNMQYGIGEVDDIDHLGNRRVRTVGELLQNQFRMGMNRIEKNVKEKLATAPEIYKVKTSTIINAKPLTSIIGEFFNLSQLSQFMDQINPLSELTNKRRLTALGPGGLSRDRAGLEVRDVHPSHYGRICPIETPEGPNIGLINNLSTYAKVNEYGFICTPYRKVNNGVIDDNDIRYLTADEERHFIIAESSLNHDENGKILDEIAISRFKGDDYMAKAKEIDYIDVSPKQIVSVATAAIPFLENDDANRALMGANMQRQAVPLVNPEAPLVGTGIEFEAARDSGAAIVATSDGVVKYVDSRIITVESKDGTKTYTLNNFERSNNGSALVHSPIVKVGDKVKKGEIIGDGSSMDNGELAIGQNVVVAFSTYNGYNFEDAIVMSERIIQEDKFTTIHVDEYTLEVRNTKIGEEEVTREIPNVSENAKKYLDADGIVAIGTEVAVGDILVGKLTPRGVDKPSPEDKLLNAIFGEKSRNVKDNSLKVPNGGEGIVQLVKRFKAKSPLNPDGIDLPADVMEIIKIYIVQKRKIQEGDKMSGRHGNKGIISRILPIEDMPHLEDGTPVDIVLNPQGIPSRMNIGQILELHLGMAAKKIGCKVSTPVFEGLNESELDEIMLEAGMTNYGKVTLIDGQTGEAIDKPIAVGVMYMLKLSHMVDDKLHARNIGPYSLITQQPLGGKAQNGGQRFGEMEVWALEAYGAAHTLREILTIKSDDIKGRTKTYEAIVRSKQIPEPGIPESFNVLTKEIMGLGFNMYMVNQKGDKIAINAYDDDDNQEFIDEDSLSYKSSQLLSFDNSISITETDELSQVDDEEIDESFIDRM